MGYNRGFIKLHRSITDNPIWKATKANPFDKRSAWIDLILMANWEEKSITGQFSGKQIVIKPGQLHTSMDHLADRWKWSRGKVIRFMEQLTVQGSVTTHGTKDGTTIELINWGSFQGQRTTDGTTLGTEDGTTDGTQLKNNKKYEEEKKEIWEEILSFYPNRYGISSISDQQKAEIVRIGPERMKMAIQRYLKELEQEPWRQQLSAKVFFTERFNEYLEDPEPKPNKNEGLQMAVVLMDDFSNEIEYDSDIKLHPTSEGWMINDDGYWEQG